jgi:predicted O-methyltransferase YrrM
MVNLFESLSNASSNAARREIASKVIHEMAAGSQYDANIAYHGLCGQVIRSFGVNERVKQRRPDGKFSTDGASDLLLKIPRVSGYLKAIERAPQARSVVDAGTGPAALLAIASKIYHPKSQVLAFDINENSVSCATEIVNLFGFSEDEVRISHGDVLKGILPDRTDLGVTETFGQGLRIENGPEIAYQLGQIAGHLIPGRVKLFATDSHPDDPWSWRFNQDIKLRDHNTHVSGSLISTYPGYREIWVRTDFLTEDGNNIVTGLSSDSLTDPMFLGAVPVPRIGSRINFRYETGPIGPQSEAELWISA